MPDYNQLAICTKVALKSTLAHSRLGQPQGIILSIPSYPRTITEWNQLPRETALSDSLSVFKNAISNIYKYFTGCIITFF